MKTLTSAALLASQKQYASEPIIVVKAEWSTGTVYYADKSFVLGSIQAKGSIVSLGAINTSLKRDNVGTIGSVDISLEDSDGSLKSLYDSSPVENTKVSIYQHWQDNAEADLLLVFVGQIIGPVSWSEGQRTFDLTIETRIQDKQAGFEPVAGRYDSDDAWPLCFGSVVHSKAIKITKRESAVLKAMFKHPQATFEVVDRGEFPEVEIIDVNIDGYIFRGSFAGNIFTVTDANTPKYENLTFATRPVDDPGVNDAAVAWLTTFRSLVNNYILIQDEFGTQIILRVIKQEGVKLYFDSIFQKGSGAVFLLDTSDRILQVAKHGREGWDFRVRSGSVLSTASVLGDVFWKMPAGTPVTRWKPLIPDTYMCNLIPSTVIKSVWGTKNGIEKNIPSTYYTKNLSYSIDGQSTTILSFAAPLADSGWAEDVFVTLKSSQGPNVVDVIQYLIETYSDLEVDAVTFSATESQVTNYPVGFSLRSKVNVLQTCEKIAWQARIGLSVESGVVKLKYLGPAPTADFTIDDSNTLLKSLFLTSNRIENVITRCVAHWSKDGLSKEKKYVYEQNIDRFGLLERDFDFFIYNVESLVQKSMQFWGNRLSKSWKLARFKASIDAIGLETFDTVDASDIVNAAELAVLQGHSYADFELGLDLWLPVQVGSATVDATAWQDDSGDTLPADPADAYGETADDQQTGDDATKHYVAALASNRDLAIVITKQTPDPPPAKPPTIPPTPAAPVEQFIVYTVDLYRDGYDRPPTSYNVTCFLMDYRKTHPTPASEVYAADSVVAPDLLILANRQKGDRVEVVYTDSVTTIDSVDGLGHEVNHTARYLNFFRFIDNTKSQHDNLPVIITAAPSSDNLNVNHHGNGTDQPPTGATTGAKSSDGSTPSVGDKGVLIKSRDKKIFVPSAPGTISALFELASSATLTLLTPVTVDFGTPVFAVGGLTSVSSGQIKVAKAGWYKLKFKPIIRRSGGTASDGSYSAIVFNFFNTVTSSVVAPFSQHFPVLTGGTSDFFFNFEYDLELAVDANLTLQVSYGLSAGVSVAPTVSMKLLSQWTLEFWKSS